MSEINILNAFQNVPDPINFILPGLPFSVVGSVISPGGVGKSLLPFPWLAKSLAVPICLGCRRKSVRSFTIYTRKRVSLFS